MTDHAAGDDLGITLRADGGVSDIPPHYYVQPSSEPDSTAPRGRCARKGCGCPPKHPVHLQPPGDDPLQGLLATGTE